MKRWIALAGISGLLACDNVDPGLVFEKYVRPDDDCLVSPDEPSAIFYTFDPFFQGDLDVFAVIRNDLIATEQEINQDLGLGFTPPTALTVSEFEYFFECDDSVFAGAPRLFLPAFGASDVPFCRDPRDEDAAFQGFDVRPTDSSSIQSGERIPIGVKIITGALGRNLEEMFVLAVATETCCNSTAPDDLCATGQINDLPDTDECNELRNAVITNRLPVTQIQTIRQYAQFDVTSDAWNGSSYTLNIRGNYVGVTSTGRTLTSNPASLTIDLIGRQLEQAFVNGSPDDRATLAAAVLCSSEVLLGN